jgi:two-component system, OmpR family, sensor kinase
VSDADPQRLRIVVHELRSPVAALGGLAEAASETTERAILHRLVELGIAAARDIERIVSDPDLFSLRLERVDLTALVSGFAQPAVAVDAEGAHVVQADPTRLRQAVSNLVANGLRHGAHVSLHVSEQAGRVELVVKDDGPGFPRGVDPFARGASGAGSTGYGLWLAQAIAVAHGGSLRVLCGDGPGGWLRLSLPSASASS